MVKWLAQGPKRHSHGQDSNLSTLIMFNLSKICTQSVSLVVYYMIFIKKVVSLYGALPYCLFPGGIVTWAWSLAKGQYMVSWLLTGAPEQRYWQNRETANVGLDSSVGRAPARQSGGRRFKSRSSQFSLFIQIYFDYVTAFFVFLNLEKIRIEFFIICHFGQPSMCRTDTTLTSDPH